MSRPLVRSELVGADLVWLLSVTYAGRVFRWSSRPVHLTNVDGEVLPFAGGLPEVGFTDAVELLSATPAELSIPFRVVFPVDVAALVSGGHPLAGAAAEVAVIVDAASATYEQRRVVLAGFLLQPTYGASGEECTFSVEAPPWDDRAQIPSASQRVSASTWATAPTSSYGTYYPLVFGTPGAFTTTGGTASITSGSPALIVDVTGANTDTLVIAGHWVEALNVRIYDGNGTGENFAVTNTSDDLGQNVATVDITGAATIARTTDEYWVGWDSLGAMLNDAQDGARTGAGEIIEWALRLSTAPHDAGLWHSARAALDPFRLSGYIDEPVSPWEWLADNVLPLLPVSVQSGPAGSYPVVHRYDATAADAIESVTVGAGFVRLGPVAYDAQPSDMINEVRVDFAKRARKGTPFRTVTIGPAESDDPDVFVNFYARTGFDRHGVMSTTIDTDIVYETATALRVARWMVRARSLAARTVSYSAPLEYGWLKPGDVLTLTDAELSLTAHVVLLTGVTWAPSSLELTFLIPDDPPRDSRPTG